MPKKRTYDGVSDITKKFIETIKEEIEFQQLLKESQQDVEKEKK